MACETARADVTDAANTYQRGEDESLSEAVIHAVAQFTGREIGASSSNNSEEELDTLYNVIDPDALDALFRTSERRPSPQGVVGFRYSGCEVIVDNTGLIVVKDL